MHLNVSIRTKIIGAQIFLVSVVSAFIYTYYPDQQKKQAIEAIDGKIRSISNMFSIGVGIGMGDTDFVAVGEALTWANTDSSVVYISVTDHNKLSIALWNPGAITIPQEVTGEGGDELFHEENRTIFYKTSITYQRQPFGTLVIGYSLKNLDASLSHLRSTTLYFCLALVTCGVVLSFILADMITRNIMKLDSAVKAITIGVDHARVNVSSNDEIGKLGKAFNIMIDRLDASRTELINYSAQLKKQNEELNQFSYVVSHDLKAPLRAIFKLSEWIEEDLGPNLPEEPKKNLQTLRGRVFRMEGLINGLLEYSKIGKQNVLAEKTDTQQMVKDIIDLLNPPASLKIRVSPNLPVFKTKKISLGQVFANLISNAIKYNDKPDGMVAVDVKDKGEFYEFSVSDNGIGIDCQYHEKVFTIFQTLEARDKVESTGIGLSIVKKSIEDVGGTIHIESELGKGAKFIFTWPKETNSIKKINYN